VDDSTAKRRFAESWADLPKTEATAEQRHV